MRFKALAIFGLGLATALAFAAPLPPCPILFERVGREAGWVIENGKVFGVQTDYVRIPESSMRHSTLAASELGNPNAVYVGVSENGHAYVIAGEKRFDGEMMFGSVRLEDTNNLTPGLVIELDDGTGELKNAMLAEWAKDGGPEAVTCVSGACKSTKGNGAGLKANGRPLSGVLPQTLIKKLLRKQLTCQAKPVTSRVFVLGDVSVASLQRGMRNQVAARLAPLAALGGFYAMYAGLHCL